MAGTVSYSACPVKRVKPPSKLMQSLFELCVVVGMDEDTGLIPVSRSRRGSSVSNASSDEYRYSLFAKEYDASILAVLSGQIVSFPETMEPIHGEPYYVQEHVAFNNCQGTLSPGKKVYSGKLRFAKPVDLPLGQDVIFSLPQFCFPDGAYIYESKPDESIHTLVLTDIEGRRSYCSCLTYYKPYYVTEDNEIPGQCKLFVRETEDIKGKVQICYIPTCCCLVSKFPYFHIAKDCLSSFLPVLNKNGRKMRESIMPLISNLCQVPIPPPGPISIEFELCNMKHLVKSAGEPKKRIIDMEYHLPFLCFSIDDILLLLSCILTQQRIIFLASDYSLLVPITEALLSYIQPLLWSLTYVPVLPSNLIDLLEAPGSFIMGCHSGHHLEVMRLLYAQDEESGIVSANIDTGAVETGNTLVPMIPEPYRDDFRQKISHLNFHYDLEEVSSASIFDVTKLKKRRRVFNEECANSILEVCFELMLNLFSEFTHFIKGGSDKAQQVLFDRVGFVECKPEKDREFFRQLCGSHAFSTYLLGIYEEDEVDFLSNAISENLSSVGHRIRSLTSTEIRRRSSNSLTNGKLTIFEDEVFKLTAFVEEGLHTGRFYQNCIKDLNILVQSSDQKSSSVKACYLYLRGMMYVGNGQIYEGLDDFFALSSKSVQIFPRNSIVEILSQYNINAMEELKTKSYFRKVDLLLRKHKKIVGAGSFKARKQLIFDGVPRYPVGKDEFIERVMLCQITESTKTAGLLFSVLAASTGEKSIHPRTFSDLYATLNQADSEAQSVDLQGLTVEEHEFVIKVSSLITTSLGVGRLLLTNVRLLFMADGSSSCIQLTRLLDIASVERSQHYTVLPPGVPALRIIQKDKHEKPFTACLKGERDIWLLYLMEMKVSHERAEALKDPQFVSFGSQNVMLADALMKSGLQLRSALTMCYFTRTTETVKQISGDTEKFLLQRLNPSEKDTATTTVEALVYVPKVAQDVFSTEQIWCGMGSGSIVIFKRAATSERWNFETHISCANDRVSCLLVVDNSHVWAGSFDATIYVFDRSTTYKANQHLAEHSDIVSAMLLQHKDKQSIVWSASLNGQIIGWDAVSLTPHRKIKLNDTVRTFVSFLLVGKYFWCDIKSSIMVVDSEKKGDICNKLEVKNGERGLSIDCMISVSSKQVWCACGKEAKVAIFNTQTLAYTLLPMKVEDTQVALTEMALMGNEVWVGNKKGHIYVLPVMREESLIRAKEVEVKKTLKIHDDSVRSMCVIRGGYVATGPGSKDGKIAIWRYEEESDKDLGFETFSEKEVKDATVKTLKRNGNPTCVEKIMCDLHT